MTAIFNSDQMMYERKDLARLQYGLDLIGEGLHGKWKIHPLWFINEEHKRPGELQRTYIQKGNAQLRGQS